MKPEGLPHNDRPSRRSGSSGGRRADMAARAARRNFGIGLLAIALSILALYLAFAGLPLQGGYKVSAIVPRATQVHANSPVRIAGVNVGKVVRVGRGPHHTAKITMRIDDAGRPLHRDATLKIRPRLFLEGNFFVDLRPGTPGAPELDDGDTLPITQTAVPVQFDELLTALQRDTRRDLVTVLEQYRAALDKGGAAAINRAFGPSEAAFKGFARVSEEARGLSHDDVSAFLADNARVTTALARRRGELAGLVTSFRRTIDAFATQAREVGETTRQVAELTEEAHPALGDVNRALPALRRMAHELRPLARRSGRTLRLALPLLRQLDRLVTPPELPALLRDARPALRSLAALERPLTGLLGQVTPVSRCVAEHALPVLNSTLDDGHLSTGMKVWQEFFASAVGLASAAQNFDGNGATTHLLAGAGEQSIASGEMPGVGRLVGQAALPLVGSRPAPPKRRPPFRPDAPCTTQDAPKLDAAFRAAPPARRHAVAPRAQRRDAARRVLGALRTLRRMEDGRAGVLDPKTVVRTLDRAVEDK